MNITVHGGRQPVDLLGDLFDVIRITESHAASALTISFQSAPACGGARMRHSRPALTQRAWHAAAAVIPARSASAKMVKLLMPGRMGNLSIAPAEPHAQTGHQPAQMTVRALSMPSAMPRPSVTSASPVSFSAAPLAGPSILLALPIPGRSALPAPSDLSAV